MIKIKPKDAKKILSKKEVKKETKEEVILSGEEKTDKKEKVLKKALIRPEKLATRVQEGWTVIGQEDDLILIEKEI